MKKINFSKSGIKMIIIFVLILLFLIPLALIKDLIRDRRNYQQNAVSSIISPLGGKTEIQGAVVSVPYKVRSETIDSRGVKHVDTSIKYVLFAPDVCSLDIRVDPYYLSRGIFKVPVFQGEISFDISFNGFDCSHYKISEEDMLLDEAVFMLGFAGPKSLSAQPVVKAGETDLLISPVKYDSISPFATTVCFNMPKIVANEKVRFTGLLKFQGGEEIKIQPVAGDNEIKMTSSWTSPSFSGGWLPSSRNVGEDGFQAAWNIAGLSTAFPKSWKSGSEIKGESFQVSFITPVDTYKKMMRSIKYALLFLLVPFVSIFICELFSNVRVHPVQYCLVGLADVMFYLLLLSISEHLTFNVSYFVSAVSVCAATLLYSACIFGRIKWGLLLSGIQMISYVFLYGTLQAEDYALLIGSIGLFMVIILLMFITRKIDWYEINQTA